MTDASRQGLFAFDGDRFHHHFQEQPELDHVMWFEQMGLPSHGPAYDAILRGKVVFDLDTDQIIVGFYGTAYLSNRRYQQIAKTFSLDESRIVEKMLSEAY